MIRRPPRSTLFPYTTALPISRSFSCCWYSRFLGLAFLPLRHRKKRKRRPTLPPRRTDRKSTRLNSSHGYISYAVFCLKKKNTNTALHELLITIYHQTELPLGE